jgi:sarcosine oxidase subunit alpha
MGRSTEAEIRGVPVRIVRAAFVAKQAYEVYMPTGYGLNIWKLLLEAGKNEGIRPFGTDTQRLLRLEMGHSLPGVDTDGLTNPFEMRADQALEMDKPFFIGKRSLEIAQRWVIFRGPRWRRRLSSPRSLTLKCL